MRHILLIDQLKDLDVKKDSTILLALSMQSEGIEVYLTFKEDISFKNYVQRPKLKAYRFSGSFSSETFYVSDFVIEESVEVPLDPETTIHMRLDPPFDTTYLRVLWLLRSMQQRYDIKTFNDVSGVMLNNEKLLAFEYPNSPQTFIGESADSFVEFCQFLKKESFESIILKPLDLYQGIGVEKVSLSSEKSLASLFEEYSKKFGGAVVAQPYLKEVEQGEIRTVYFYGEELGTIIKIPPAGSYLANIARGAKFSRYEMSTELKNDCKVISDELAKIGVHWLAFDILGGMISEVNVTCPGLLVEVSNAMEKNLAVEISRRLKNFS